MSQIRTVGDVGTVIDCTINLVRLEVLFVGYIRASKFAAHFLWKLLRNDYIYIIGLEPLRARLTLCSLYKFTLYRIPMKFKGLKISMSTKYAYA